MSKLNFYTEKVKGGFVGLCRENTILRYGPKKNRDAALSGVKRLVSRLKAANLVTPLVFIHGIIS